MEQERSFDAVQQINVPLLIPSLQSLIPLFGYVLGFPFYYWIESDENKFRWLPFDQLTRKGS